MKTVVTTAALTIMFLSVGAFASDNRGYVPSVSSANITIVVKNRAWPVKSQVTMEPCRMVRCVDA